MCFCIIELYNMSVLWTHAIHLLQCEFIHVCFYSGLKYLFVLQTHRIYRSVLRPIQPVLFIADSYNMNIWQAHTTQPIVLHAHTDCIAGSQNIPVFTVDSPTDEFVLSAYTTCLFVLCSNTTCVIAIWVHATCLYCKLTRYVCFYCVYTQHMCLYCGLIQFICIAYR